MGVQGKMTRLTTSLKKSAKHIREDVDEEYEYYNEVEEVLRAGAEFWESMTCSQECSAHSGFEGCCD